MRAWFQIVLGLLAIVSSARASTEWIIGGSTWSGRIESPGVEAFLDPSCALRITDVIADSRVRFSPCTENIPSFGFTKSAVWVRFVVRSTSENPERLVVRLGTARLSHFSWHVVDGTRLVKSVTGGAADGAAPAVRLPTVELEIPAGETRTIYGRAESDTAVWLKILAGSPVAMERLEEQDTSRQMLQIGFCIAVGLFGLLFGLVNRQKLFFLLTGIAACHVFYCAVFNGFARMAWPGIPLWFERGGFGAITSLGGCGFLLFNRHYLGVRSARGFVHLLQWLPMGACVLAFGLFLILPFHDSVRVWNVLLITVIVAESLWIATRFRRRHPGDYWFLLAWSGIGVSITLLALQFPATLPMLVPADRLQHLMVPFILVSFVLAVVTHQTNLRDLELRLAEARRAASEARLTALRHRINPHFLFNVLTSIDALSRVSPERVPPLVSRLATFLRLRLAPCPEMLAPFRHELETARAYLDIEQVRFGESLSASYDIAPESMEWLVPELLLQPLVEEGVKCGFEHDVEVHILVASRLDSDGLVISVTHSGCLPASSAGDESIRKRLSLHYGRRADCSVSGESGSVTTRIFIPNTRCYP